MKNTNISIRFALVIIMIFVVGVSWIEARALYKLDHPPLQKINCISCHSDESTLKAMAEKSGDKYYLVHRGDLKSLPYKVEIMPHRGMQYPVQNSHLPAKK